MLDVGFDRGRSSDSLTLYNAVKTNEQHLVTVSIQRGADVNFVCAEEPIQVRTPLRAACSQANVKVIHMLLEHGAEVCANFEKDKWTALHSAAHAGFEKVVRMLLVEVEELHDKHSFDGFTLLHILAECLNSRLDGVELFAFVLRHMHSVDVNARSQRLGYLDWTPLHMVCARGCTKVATLLIRSRAQVSARTGEFHLRSPMKNLFAAGDGQVADLEADYGKVEPHWFDSGLLPLHLAAFGGHSRTWQMLLKNGQHVNAETQEHKWTSLMFAAWSGNVQLVAEICRVGGREAINRIDRRACGTQLTPLAVAVMRWGPDMVQTLVAYGADPLVRLSFADFPGQGFVEHMAPVLLDAQNDRWSGSDNRISLLHLAVLRGNLRILQVVLEFVRAAHFSPVRSASGRPTFRRDMARAAPSKDPRRADSAGRHGRGSRYADNDVTDAVAKALDASIAVQDKARERLLSAPVTEGQDCDPVAFCSTKGWSPAVLAVLLHTVDPMRQVPMEFLKGFPILDRADNNRADIFLELFDTGNALLEDRAEASPPSIPQRFADVSETLACRAIDEFVRLCKVYEHMKASGGQAEQEANRVEMAVLRISHATLCVACRFNRIQVVKHLLESGLCDPLCRFLKPVECRPLHIATACGFGYLAQMLLEHKADPLEGDESDEMPVFKLARFYSRQVSELQGRVAELEARLSVVESSKRDTRSMNLALLDDASSQVGMTTALEKVGMTIHPRSLHAATGGARSNLSQQPSVEAKTIPLPRHLVSLD